MDFGFNFHKLLTLFTNSVKVPNAFYTVFTSWVCHQRDTKISSRTHGKFGMNQNLGINSHHPSKATSSIFVNWTWENGDSEKLSNLSKVTELTNDRARIQTQMVSSIELRCFWVKVAWRVKCTHQPFLSRMWIALKTSGNLLKCFFLSLPLSLLYKQATGLDSAPRGCFPESACPAELSFLCSPLAALHTCPPQAQIASSVGGQEEPRYLSHCIAQGVLCLLLENVGWIS